MLFEVLREQDPQHVLLELAWREALSAELDRAGLAACLQRLSSHELLAADIDELTPFSFPLWAEYQRGEVSSEDWRTRIERAAAKMEAGDG
jgi:ATP-dependent Lhr-like helicase